MKRLFKYIGWSWIFLCILTLASGCSSTPSPGTDQTLRPSEQPQKTQEASVLPSPTASPTPTPTPSPTPAVSAEKVKKAEELYEQGFTLYNEFNYDGAIKLYNKALEADPYSYKAFNGKGIALCFKGNYNEGMPLIQKALDVKPDFAYAHFNMAMAYKLQKDYQNSLLWFNKALALDPKDTWSYYGISTIYADWNDVPKALEYLKKAIELDPGVKGVAREQDHFVPFRSNPEFTKLVN